MGGATSSGADGGHLDVRWILGEGGASASKAIEGEPFTLAAWFGGDSVEMLNRTYTATYEDDTQCSSTCRVYESNP